jgi:hypothetical protein
MSSQRYLTKSRFKLATECPTKLFYTNKDQYANKSIDDTFLLALADGGFQVGELAKCYFPNGTSVETLDYEEALRQSNELLCSENVVIFEAAIRFQNFFVRIDILVKTGARLDLIEVKSKSFDPTTDSFTNKNRTISSSWKPYLFDVAFQKYVLAGAYPQHNVSAYLMLADKSIACTTDGLNQKFRVKSEGGRRQAFMTQPVTNEDLDPPILRKINVDDLCTQLYDTAEGSDGDGRDFAEMARYYADSYLRDVKIVSRPNVGCNSCEFYATTAEISAGLRSGFRECWSEALGWTDEDFEETTILEISNYHHTRKAARFDERRLKICELTEDDVSPKPDGKPGCSQSERQWIQVQKVKNRDASPWIEKRELANELKSWIFPLHFIDFETSMAAIPFNRGRRPYEGIAFQFSHHVVLEDGSVIHQGEYLETEPGKFPNYDFLRALKRELDGDAGSIFRYADHENSYLNMIYRQLKEDQSDIQDRDSLLAFVRTITKSSKGYAEEWEGNRNMVDMCRLVKRFYYHPNTRGSNSIKKVLPAILGSSDYLQDKYSKPVYGCRDGIPSLNFQKKIWVEFDHGSVRDPYKLLPKMFADIDDAVLVRISEGDELNDGGAAMTAYARLQFEEMSDYERDEIKKALLKYCELDTLAMVMLYEGWRAIV